MPVDLQHWRVPRRQCLSQGYEIYQDAVKALKGKEPERGWRKELAAKISKQCKIALSSANNFVQVYSNIKAK